MEEKKKKKRFPWMHILGGGILEESFMVRHTKMIVLIVIMLFFYISNRYACIIKIREIDRLQVQLKEVRSENLSTLVQLTGNTQPSQIEEAVKRLGLDIEKAKTPPFKLQK